MKSTKKLILDEAKKGNVVYLSTESLIVAPLDEFVNQMTGYLLYDLNRLPEVILTFIDDPKWVNDYAVYQVIKRLKERLDVFEKKEEDA